MAHFFSESGRRVSLAILTGVLLTISWPPLSVSPVIFVAFVPLFWSIHDLNSVKKSFLYTYLAFFVWTVGTMYWIGNARVGGRGYLVMAAAWLLIPLFQCIPMVLFFWLKKKWNSNKAWLFLPLLWISYEYLHSQWDLAFTWLHLGLGLTTSPFLIQFYKITGYLGGSMVILYFNVLIFLIVLNYKSSSVKKFIIAASILMVSILVINYFLLPSQVESSQKAKVAYVQLSLDPYAHMDKQSVHDVINKAEQATKDLPRDVDLVVFPEGFIKTSPLAPLVFNNPDRDSLIIELKRISKKIDAPILTGFIGFKLYKPENAPPNALPTGDGPYFAGFNGIMLVSPDQPTQIQTKRHLVPFMERVPFIEYFSFFEKFRLGLNQMMASYTKNTSVKILTYKQLRIAPFICLDALFPEDGGTFVDQRANVIAVITNDGWAGNTSGYQQNASYATNLAVSLNREVVRAASTGISKFIDVKGQSHKETGWGKKAVIMKEVYLHNNVTPYAIFGDVIGLISVVISSLIIVFNAYKQFNLS